MDGEKHTYSGLTSSWLDMGSFHWRRPIENIATPFGEPDDWRAVCGKTARTVRREGRPGKPAVPTPIWREPVQRRTGTDQAERPPASALAEQTAAQPVAHSVPSLEVEPVQRQKGRDAFPRLGLQLFGFFQTKIGFPLHRSNCPSVQIARCGLLGCHWLPGRLGSQCPAQHSDLPRWHPCPAPGTHSRARRPMLLLNPLPSA